jgi:lipoprotein-anchoring transpeptidase ErfK/SrfK
MESEGVAAKALEPLVTSLRTSSYTAAWWSPTWWNDPGSAFLASLDARTIAVWNGAVASARTKAAAALASWDLFAEHDATVLPASAVVTLARWRSSLATATTPATIASLTTSLSAYTAAEERAGAEQVATLVAAMPANLRTLELMADQAGAEAIPGAGGYLAGYDQVARAAAARPVGASLAALSTQVASLDASVSAALQSHACGHAVPSGKAIVIDLALQEVVFYQDGCALKAAPVTSGRRGERTPTGTFHVFRKDAPVVFTSWAGRGSPFWYPPERADYALEFTVVRAGIFLHDAPWEASGAFGPGSDNSSSASHGCVHAPTSVMAWAYTWAPIGTPVIVTD